LVVACTLVVGNFCSLDRRCCCRWSHRGDRLGRSHGSREAGVIRILSWIREESATV
jgi:hypothetical protein